MTPAYMCMITPHAYDIESMSRTAHTSRCSAVCGLKVIMSHAESMNTLIQFMYRKLNNCALKILVDSDQIY